MEKPEIGMTALQRWLSYAAFTLSGVAFEGARYGSVLVPSDENHPPASVGEE
ncbi:hypothetical protein [Pantoea sp. SGAir0180]